mmetsp:Transcript_53213/g.129227  ORF Transcript_53213/g.129227 Transcript_53213/m.129227 type:complete len:375 (-) Transcript_53213:180-1304(-)
MSPSSTSSSKIPSTMKAIQVHEFMYRKGNNSSNDTTPMTMSDDVPVPVPAKDELLIRVLACSISPGDVLMVKGSMIFMAPPKGFPFIPGMDVTGEIVGGCGDNDDGDNANEMEGFRLGDVVVASNGTLPVGGMAQYMCIKKSEAVKKPEKVSTTEAAASSSAITARNAVLKYVKKGDRVLVLGGSGGVGTAAIQLCKIVGASFIATTSTQDELCRSLGADDVVDYRNDSWQTLDRWGGQKFDKIIDTVGGGNFKDGGKVLKPFKDGGYFVAVAGDDPKPDLSSWFKAIRFFFGLLKRPLYTWMRKSSMPGFSLLMPEDVPQGRKQVLEWMNDGQLDVKLDESSPLPFTEEGVRKAFDKVASGHAHGKVVVSISP